MVSEIPVVLNFPGSLEEICVDSLIAKYKSDQMHTTIYGKL